MQRINKFSGHLSKNSTAAVGDKLSVKPEGPADTVSEAVYNKWHHTLASALENDAHDVNKDKEMIKNLDELLSDDIIFRAPTYWKTRKDKTFAKYALLGVTKVFKDFKYNRRFIAKRGMVLEFECRIGDGGPMMRGADLITFNDEGKITEFEVVARPPNAVMKLAEYQTDFMTKMGLVKPTK